MSHVAMAALAISVVVAAGLGLIFVSGHFQQHPGAVLGVIFGGAALIALAIFVGRRRREHA